MLVRDILKSKGSRVLVIAPTASLANVVQTLVENNCGSLVVCENDRMVGIVTERDILRTVADPDRPLSDIRVEEKMTRHVFTVSPDDNVSNVMGMITNHRIRHVPVTENGKLVGMISVGDVIKAQHDQLSFENHYLMSYIQS